MSQKARKEQEAVIVRRLTAGAGAAALGMAWYFTASAATAAPIALGAQPAADAQQPVIGVEQLDDRVFVRTVHVPPIRPPAGGVKAGSQPGGGGQAPAGQTTPTGPRSSGAVPAQAAPTAAPIAQPVPPPATPARVPTPVATTAPTPPVKK